jgi:hypothetical protein
MDTNEFALVVSSVLMSVQIAVSHIIDERQHCEELDEIFLQGIGVRSCALWDIALYIKAVALH